MIGKDKLSVVTMESDRITITEQVKNAPNKDYRASLLTNYLTKKQALALGLLLIKAAQQ